MDFIVISQLFIFASRRNGASSLTRKGIALNLLLVVSHWR